MRLRACSGVASSVTVEYWRRSPLFGSSTERWPVAITSTLWRSGKVILRPFRSTVTSTSMTSPGSRAVDRDRNAMSSATPNSICSVEEFWRVTSSMERPIRRA